MSNVQTRQPKGITTGGQFAAATHAEPDFALRAFDPADLRELAKPVEMPPGSQVYIDGKRGTVADEPVPAHRIIVNLETGGSIHTRRTDAVPWDAWLDASMPAVELDLLDSPVPSDVADHMLHKTLRSLRNSNTTATELGDTYHAGRAQACAEVSAALLDTRLDAAAIKTTGKNFLTSDMFEALHDRDRLLAYSSGEPITPLRARQLAGHFANEAIHAHAAASAEECQGAHGKAQTHHGRSHAYISASLQFIQGCAPDPHSLDRQNTMIREIVEGNTTANNILRAGLNSW